MEIKYSHLSRILIFELLPISLLLLDVRDIVQLAKFDEMEKGVIALNVSGSMIYDITPNFYSQVSTPQVFSPLWPQKFSVMARIRPRKTKYPREGQYLFSVSDSSGRLYLGLKAYPSPTLEILHSTGRMSSVSIPRPMASVCLQRVWSQRHYVL